GHVRLDGTAGQQHLGGYVGVRAALRDQRDDTQLGRGERGPAAGGTAADGAGATPYTQGAEPGVGAAGVPGGAEGDVGADRAGQCRPRAGDVPAGRQQDGRLLTGLAARQRYLGGPVLRRDGQQGGGVSVENRAGLAGGCQAAGQGFG